MVESLERAMQTCVSGPILQPGVPIKQVLDQAALAGFDAIELDIGPGGALALDAAEQQCADIARYAQNANLEISALALCDCREANLASPDPAARRTAYDRTIAAMDRAACLDAHAVHLVPAIVGDHSPSRPATRYEDAYTFAMEALLKLRFEAGRRTVKLACRGGSHGFLLSPLELKAFLDRLNSPWVGAALDLAEVTSLGSPPDWLLTLGHRVTRVYFSIGGPTDQIEIDWVGALAALREIRYAGPFTCRASGDLADLRASLDKLLRSA
jgi:hexulose-6-phosphate isomerase